MRSRPDSTSAFGHPAIGKVGTIITRVRGGDLSGEVRCVADGDTHTFLAFSPEVLGRGTSVLILSIHGPRSVDAEKWDAFDLTVPGQSWRALRTGPITAPPGRARISLNGQRRPHRTAQELRYSAITFPPPTRHC